MDKKLKWYTEVENVDIETGEIITKSLQIREYIIINKTKTIKINHNEGIGIIKRTNECKKTRQTKLW